MAHTSSATPGTPGATQPPAVKGNLLLGNLPELRRGPLAFLQRLARQGDVVYYRLGFFHEYLLSHPDHVKHVLQEQQKNYSKDFFSYKMLRWIVGNGLVTSEGSFWLRQRRLMQPAFHRQRIVALGTQITGATEAMLAGWAGRAQAGETVDMAAEMMRLTLTIVGQALFGANVSGEVASIGRAFSTLNEQLTTRFRSLQLLPPVLPWGRDRAWRQARAALDQVVFQIIQERRRDGVDRGDLLSMLLLARDEDTGEQMDDGQIRDEVLTLLLAGHETTATTLAWTWYLLARHPQIDQRLRAELAEVLDGRAPTMADLPRLSYTRMVIEEAMRLYPPAWVLSRKVLRDDVIGGYRIPAGTVVTISPYVMHRHPAYWERPDEFFPEHFAPEAVAARPRYAYFPFSGGPRQCIGNTFAMAEAQLILAAVAQRYRPRLANDGVVEPEPLITLRPRGGVPMVLEPA